MEWSPDLITSRAVASDGQPRQVEAEDNKQPQRVEFEDNEQPQQVEVEDEGQPQQDGTEGEKNEEVDLRDLLLQGKRGDLRDAVAHSIDRGILSEEQGNAIVSHVRNGLLSYEEGDEIVGLFSIGYNLPEEETVETVRDKIYVLDNVEVPHYNKLAREARKKETLGRREL